LILSYAALAIFHVLQTLQIHADTIRQQYVPIQWFDPAIVTSIQARFLPFAAVAVESNRL
jgi:hypothetical protein